MIKTDQVVNIDDSEGLGRVFDGIGAISGGGATSKLLQNYQEPYRTYILDYLFKPGFAASLQVLKVEIGGDSQSAEGSESSHMHSVTDENYHRGYEWWLMGEAKKRNPNIKLYGLPWVWPGWLGGAAATDPYTNIDNTAKYIVNWVKGAKREHGLKVDYVGIWNERTYNTTYIKTLRKRLDQAGFIETKIVAADGEFNIIADLDHDQDLLSAVHAVGVHYPACFQEGFTPPEALRLDIPLWASEDFSTYNSPQGGACWARILNEDYAYGHLTSVIAWNLIMGYYYNLPYPRSSLMVANEPWSGHYDVDTPVWITAHHTHFYQPGDLYLKHARGVGFLQNGGTFVSIVDKLSKDLTIVIETIDPYYAPCFYALPKYNVSIAQTITFGLKGSFGNITKLNVKRSWFDSKNDNHVIFEDKRPVNVHSGIFQLTLQKNEVYTLSTKVATRVTPYPKPPASKPFPDTYLEDFEHYSDHAEAYNLAQQAGAYEVLPSGDSSHGKVLVQTVPDPPIDTCRPEPMPAPIVIFGNYNWTEVDICVDVYIGNASDWTHGFMLGARVETGGCWTMYSNGVFLWINAKTKMAAIAQNYTATAKVVERGFDFVLDKWHNVCMSIHGHVVSVFVDYTQILQGKVDHFISTSGFAAFGQTNYGRILLDNLNVSRSAINRY